MVKSVAAAAIIKDTTTILLKSELISLNSDRSSTSFKSFFHLVGASCSNTNTSSGANAGAINFMTSSIFTRVGVLSLKHGVMSFEVLVGVFLQATVATIAHSDTVNELLLGKLEKSSCGNSVTVLNRLKRTESPA